ncbi:MAG: hypothetical protein ACOC7K_02455, partial [bacterium]
TLPRRNSGSTNGTLPVFAMTAEARFVGYDFWCTVLSGSHKFVIRSGGNVRLTKHLGFARRYDQAVYLWPVHFWPSKGANIQCA